MVERPIPCSAAGSTSAPAACRRPDDEEGPDGLAFYQITGHPGLGPIVATAIHAGHGLRPEVRAAMALDPEERRREEDPYTDCWTVLADSALRVLRSRFEVDCNRPREGAVYRSSEEAWGLEVWKEAPAADLVARSLEAYDRFYAALGEHLCQVEACHGRFVVLDLHSYNHRRAGPDAPPADPADNPEVNVGTGTVDFRLWRGLVSGFVADLRSHDFGGRALDVRENVRFRGGYLSRWIHQQFPGTGCALAIEIKKFYMDEWTGAPRPALVSAVGRALGATLPGLRKALKGA